MTENQGASNRNDYNSQFLFDSPAPSKTKKPKKRMSQKRLTFFTATSAAVMGALIGASVGAGAGVVAYNYLSRPPAIVVNNTETVNWVTAAAATASPSVVTIRVSTKNSGGNGSGVVLSKDGYILTNAHVVLMDGTTEGVDLSVRFSDGSVLKAELVGVDPTNDLAVVKVEITKPIEPITFADSSKLNVGDSVVAIGAPLGLDATVTRGIVSALNRTIQVASSENKDQSGLEFWSGNSGAPINLKVIQTDAAINPGNSGGALVNERGELVGINVAIASTSSFGTSGNIGVGFAIPSNVANRIAAEIIETGSASHGLLGALVSDNRSSDDGAAFSVGVRVVEVTAGGAAELAGIKPDDVITHFGGFPVESASELTAAVRQEPAGTKVEVRLLREGVEITVEVVLQDAKDLKQ
ncbi:MAG: S1C family serine protease [Actinomycetota bacterium]